MEPASRHIPARWIATIEGELVFDELPDFLESTFAGLITFASTHGLKRPGTSTAQWPALAIYYGILDKVRPIRVEAALVIPDYTTPDGLIRVRQEPAHDEVYASLTRRALGSPAVRHTYDALGKWVVGHGRPHPELAPRDVYVADVMASRLDDHVCDVAFPYIGD